MRALGSHDGNMHTEHQKGTKNSAADAVSQLATVTGDEDWAIHASQSTVSHSKRVHIFLELHADQL